MDFGLLIQDQMHIRRVLLLIVSVFLHVSTGATSLENRKSAEEDLLASLIKYGGINHDQVVVGHAYSSYAIFSLFCLSWIHILMLMGVITGSAITVCSH